MEAELGLELMTSMANAFYSGLGFLLVCFIVKWPEKTWRWTVIAVSGIVIVSLFTMTTGTLVVDWRPLLGTMDMVFDQFSLANPWAIVKNICVGLVFSGVTIGLGRFAGVLKK